MSQPRRVEVPQQPSNALAAAVAFDWEIAGHSVESARPGMRIFRLEAKTGERAARYLGFPA